MTLLSRIILDVIARQPGISFRAIRERLPRVSSKQLRPAVRALVLAEQIRPETAEGLTHFYPRTAIK